MAARSSIQVIGLLCISAALAGCANKDVLGQLADDFNLSSKPRAEYLNEKCSRLEARSLWTAECSGWRDERAAKEKERRQAEAAAREAELEARWAIQREEEARKKREAEEREMAAVQADERDGYKHLSFDDFALDAESMKGAKIALYGVYVGKGERLARNQLAALMWTERAHGPKGELIPLVTSGAVRDSRAVLLRCDASPIGCAIVVRGRVRVVTMRNAFGTSSQELGVVVESVR